MTKNKLKLVTLAIVALFASPAYSNTITYNDFSSTAGLTLVGNAATAVTGDGTVLRLTPANYWQTGAAYSTSPITLGASDTFSTTFQFRITNPGGINPADGITFVLAASPTGLGNAGVGIGYAGVQNSVAIEFDTYNNTGFGLGNNDGNSSNHIAIDTNGVLTNSALTNVYGVQNCNFSTGLGSGCMSNGDLWTVKIGYNGSALSVTAQDGTNPVFSAISSYPINVASNLGTTSAYVGFTSGTGAGYENHDIINWQFANTTALAPVPEPETYAMLLAGLGLIGFIAYRRKEDSSDLPMAV
jgi:hypothetical protein